MVEANTPKDSLEQALAKLVFGADLGDSGVDERVARVVGLIETVYRSQLGRIRNRWRKGDIESVKAAMMVVLYGLTEHLAKAVGITTREKRKKLLNALRSAQNQDKTLLFAAVRDLLAMSVDANDKAAARKLTQLAEDLAASTSEGGSSNDTEENIMHDIMDLMAFDEARLPANLHYGDDGDASDGQKHFLEGTKEALEMLGVEEKHMKFFLLAVASILLLDGHYDPDDRAFYDHVRTAYTELLEPASAQRDEIIANEEFEPGFPLKRDVFVGVLGVLKSVGSPQAAIKEKIFFHALAAVYRGMVAIFDTRPPKSPAFSSSVKALYADEILAAGGSGGGGSGIAYLDLPPLSDPEGGSEQIVPANIRTVSGIYVVYQCEQMLLFDVVDRIVELFMAGLLPMGGDTLARNLDDYYWKVEDRISKMGREAQYTRALGAPGGDIGTDVTPNTQFNPALMHVISSLSEFERQRNVGNLFQQDRRYTMATTGEYVRKSVRDLAANCTLYGYAGAQFAAERLGTQLNQAINILQLPRIREIYGVDSMWQVIERVAQSEFGTTVNIVKHRTLAEETRAILEIVAEKHHIWSLSSSRPLFTINGHNGHNGHNGQGGDLTAEEGDRLFRAAQYFLAVNGVQNDQVYEHSQPTDTPALPSIPGMGAFGGGGAAPGMSGGDVAGQLKEMLDRGQTPSADQIRAMVGF